jgi:hypothetical protein
VIAVIALQVSRVCGEGMTRLMQRNFVIAVIALQLLRVCGEAITRLMQRNCDCCNSTAARQGVVKV